MKNNTWYLLLAGLLCAVLLLTAAVPAWVLADEADSTQGADAAGETPSDAAEDAESTAVEEIHIASAEDFADFTASCTLDTWSQRKRFVLDCDITLESENFVPAATFGGVFLGAGHTIRGLSITDSAAPTGLFCVLQEGASIRDLNVEGSVSPEGDTGSVGGIVGENHGTISGCSFTGTVTGTRDVGGIAGFNTATGVIRFCRTSGALFGENRSGGVAGTNQGLISASRNNMYVNIESTDPSIDLSRIDLDFSLDLTRLTRMDTANIATDTGGIAGYSSGTIRDCTNAAAIGHEHIGYNVGGIVGRSCGQIRSCTNKGGVCGRKDVGGIAGQIEPYIEMQLSESALSKVEKQLNELNDLVNKAANNAESSANGVTSRLNGLSGYVNSAMQEASNIKLTAGIDTTIQGSGSRDSQTTLSGEVNPIDADVAHGGGAGLTVTKEPGSFSISVGHGSGTSVDIGASAGADIGHTGDVSGSLDATTQIVAAPDLGGLTSAISGIGSQLSLVNGALSGAVGTVADDVRAINNKFGELSDTIFEAISEAQQGASGMVTDMSTVDVDLITLGKTSGCTNSGTVYGDINTGGIAGAMAIEYALDPEDDVSGSLSDSYRRQYEYRAVLQKCVNTGIVTSKRSYAGGVCGRMDLGLIDGCEAYGEIASESGNYVGGIAGSTGSTVRSCFAKTSLSGQKYVGGIVGSGVAKDVSGSGSTVAGCYALVEITDCKQYSGAISGADAGSFLENYYVSDVLAGVNRRSYAGKAEPCSFDELAEAEALPEAMRTFTLRFAADGETVFSTQFHYGDSFDEDVFPSIPEKEGYSAVWDRDELTELHFDTTVTAVYTPYMPAIASTPVREDGRAILLVQGDFSESDTITVASEPLTPGAFHIRSGSLGSRIESYFSAIGTSDFSLITMNWADVEQWSVEASNGGSAHKLRYLAPGGDTKRLRIYTENDGNWEQTAYEIVGSYLVFPFDGQSVRIAVVSTVVIWWVWVLAVLLLAGLVILAVWFVRKCIRHAKRAAAPEGAKPAPAAPAPAEAPAAAERDPELLARALSAEERLARAEEELRLLREGGGAAEPHDGGTAVAVKPKKRHRWWIAVVIVLVLALAAAVVFFLCSGMRDGLDAYRLLKSCDERDPLYMTLDISASVDGDAVQTQAAVCRTRVDGTAVTCIQRGEVQLYYANGAVYLKNGKAYSLGAYPDYAGLVTKAASLYRLVDADVSGSGNSKTYALRADAGSTAELMALLLPGTDRALWPDSMDVEAVSADGRLTTLRFSASVDALTLNAEARIEDSGKLPQLPEEVRSAIATGKTADGESMTDDLFRLLEAWSARSERERDSADIALSADCGPIVVNDTLRFDRQKISGQSIGCVSKNGAAVYFSGDTLCDAAGHAITAGSKPAVDAAKLIDLAYQLMLSGTTACAQSESGYVYSLELDEDGMQQVAYAIAPEIKAQSITLKSGRIEAIVEDGTLCSLSLSCSGSVHIVVADAKASLGAKITFAEREVSMPQAVIDALKK